MGHADGDGQKAIRSADWDLGAQSGPEAWIGWRCAGSGTGLRGNAEESCGCGVGNHANCRCLTRHVESRPYPSESVAGLWPSSLHAFCQGHLIGTDGRSRGQTVSLAFCDHPSGMDQR